MPLLTLVRVPGLYVCVQELKLVIPNSERINRGGQVSSPPILLMLLSPLPNLLLSGV